MYRGNGGRYGPLEGSRNIGDFSGLPPPSLTYGQGNYYSLPPPVAVPPHTHPSQSYVSSYTDHFGPHVDYPAYDSRHENYRPRDDFVPPRERLNDSYLNNSSNITSESHSRSDYVNYRDSVQDPDSRSIHNKDEYSPSAKQSVINLDVLLQDEQLKNVLFAGISKAKAKLEHSLPNSDKDSIAFVDDSSRSSVSQLFPAAASSSDAQKPKSILKRKTASSSLAEEENTDTFSKLSALEKTLQLLRGKTNVGNDMGSSEKVSKDNVKPVFASKGALGQLASYSDGGGEEENYLSDRREITRNSSKQTSSSGHPFWSVNAVPPEVETIKRETDTFDVQERLYEQWRQSINKTAKGTDHPKRAQGILQVDPFFQKKISPQTTAGDSNQNDNTEEELDSTVQNILQSIGFNFDLSKRMQELARQKKQQQDVLQSGIIDQSASFLDQSESIGEDLRASLFRREQEKNSIESLIEEARAGTKKGRSSYEKSLSPCKLEDGNCRTKSYGSDNRRRRNRSPDSIEGKSPDHRDRRWPSHERYHSRDRSSERSKQHKDQEGITSQREELERRSQDNTRSDQMRTQSYSRERDTDTATCRKYLDDNNEGESHREFLDRYSGHHEEDRFTHNDKMKDEYFYPEDNDYTESPSTMPLLKSFSTKKKEEGLFPAMKIITHSGTSHLENLRVTSRAVHVDDGSFTESRRVILPIKSDRKVVPRSPPFKASQSPDTQFLRKRLASPLSPISQKERRLHDEKSKYIDRERTADYDSSYYDRKRSQTPDFEMRITTFRGKSPSRRESVDSQSWSRHRSPLLHRSLERDREMSPQYRLHKESISTYSRHRSPVIKRLGESQRFSLEKKIISPRSDYEQESKNKSSYYYNSRSPLHRRSRSPGRQRLRSPGRHRSRSPGRHRSRSPGRHRSRSPKRHRSRSPGKHRSKSPYRHKSQSWSPTRYRWTPERRHSPGHDRHRSPVRWRSPGRQKSPDKKVSGKCKTVKVPSGKPDINKYKFDQKEKPQEKPTVDVSKMSPERRKEYLQKLLEEKGQTVDEAKQYLLAAIERLANISVDQRKALIIKMTQVSAGERQRIMHDLSLRQVKVSALKLEIDKLKKEQNELMRRCQRSGLGTNNPSLTENAKAQEALEKEIKRLSAPDLDVPLDLPTSPPPSHHKKDISKEAPIDKNTNDKKIDLTLDGAQKPSVSEPALEKNIAGKPDCSTGDKWKSVDVVGESSSSGVGELIPKKEQESKGKISTQDHKTKTSKELNMDPRPQCTPGFQKGYFEYYDSGKHWCKHCSAACNSVEQYFEHCHGKKHLTSIELEKRPWKNKKEQKSTVQKVGVAQSRRIKGSEKMFPVIGFYCSLCKVFCGDFNESLSHLKTDSHYDMYMDFVKQNPMYEKKLLLEKTTALSVKKKAEKLATPIASLLPPPPTLPLHSSQPAETKSTANTEANKDSAPKPKVKKQLRVTGKEENSDSEGEVKGVDNTDIVDMELDENESGEEKGNGCDLKNKIPKLTAKPAGVCGLPSWAARTSDPNNTTVDMKETKEDDNKPLDQFLTIKNEASEKEKLKLPVVGSEIDICDIPIPEGPMKQQSADTSSIVYTVKSLKEIQEEEQKMCNEEKRMMGIDVDAEIEKPMSAIPVPPPSVTKMLTESASQQEEEDSKKSKPTSLDTLFARLSRSVAHKVKPKPALVGVAPIVSDMEQQIQEEIQAKLAKEKMKILRKKKKKKTEEEQTLRKRIVSDTSSSEDSDSSDEAENVENKANPGANNLEIRAENQSQSVDSMNNPENIGVVTIVELQQTSTEPMKESDVKSSEHTGRESCQKKVESMAEVGQPQIGSRISQAENMVGVPEVEQQITSVGEELKQAYSNDNVPNADIKYVDGSSFDRPETGQREAQSFNEKGNTIKAPKNSTAATVKKSGKSKTLAKVKTPSTRSKLQAESLPEISDLSAFFAAGNSKLAATKTQKAKSKKAGKKGSPSNLAATISPSTQKAKSKKAGKKGRPSESANICSLGHRKTKTSQQEGNYDDTDSLSEIMFSEGLIVLSEVTAEDQDEVVSGENSTALEIDQVCSRNTLTDYDRGYESASRKVTCGAESTIPDSEQRNLAFVEDNEYALNKKVADTDQCEVLVSSAVKQDMGRNRTDMRETRIESRVNEKQGEAIGDGEQHVVGHNTCKEMKLDMTEVHHKNLSITSPKRRGRGKISSDRCGQERDVKETFDTHSKMEDPTLEVLVEEKSTNSLSVDHCTPLTTEAKQFESSISQEDSQALSIWRGSGQVLTANCGQGIQNRPRQCEDSVETLAEKVVDNVNQETCTYQKENTHRIAVQSPFEGHSAQEDNSNAPRTETEVIEKVSSELILEQEFLSIDSEQPPPACSENETYLGLFLANPAESSAQIVSMGSTSSYGDHFDEDFWSSVSKKEATTPTGECWKEPEDSDSDATITQETEDLCLPSSSVLDVADLENSMSQNTVLEINTQTTKMAQQFSPASGQGRDPPMSGVVSEVEETDTIIIPVQERAKENLESEAPPTAGLSLGLEDDDNSMEFAVVDLQDKIEVTDE